MNANDDGRGGCLRGASTALWLWLATTTAPAQQIVQPYAAQKATTSVAAVERAKLLTTLADRQATGELVEELQRLSQNADHENIANEWLLDRGLHELSRVQPTSAAKSLLHTIAQRPPADIRPGRSGSRHSRRAVVRPRRNRAIRAQELGANRSTRLGPPCWR